MSQNLVPGMIKVSKGITHHCSKWHINGWPHLQLAVVSSLHQSQQGDFYWPLRLKCLLLFSIYICRFLKKSVQMMLFVQRNLSCTPPASQPSQDSCLLQRMRWVMKACFLWENWLSTVTSFPSQELISVAFAIAPVCTVTGQVTWQDALWSEGAGRSFVPKLNFSKSIITCFWDSHLKLWQRQRFLNINPFSKVLETQNLMIHANYSLIVQTLISEFPLLNMTECMYRDYNNTH